MAQTDATQARWASVVLRTKPPRISLPQPVEGTVVSATTEAAVVSFGGATGVSCPLPPGVTEAPAKGTRVLVVYSAQGNPWVVGVTTVPAP